MRTDPQLKIRVPADVKAFLAAEAEKNASSQTSEIVRAVRERMERTKPATGRSCQASPAAGPNDTACQGGPITRGL